MSFLYGLLTGLAMVAFIGPVLFTLLKASLSYGFRGGVAVATGIIVSDILAVLLCLLGARPIIENEDYQIWIAVLGGVLLMTFGVKYLMSPTPYTEETSSVGARDFLSLFTTGFLVNFVNPFVFLVWLSLITFAGQEFGNGRPLHVYLIGSMIGIFATDCLKAYFAPKLNRFLNSNRLRQVYMIFGVAMVAFAIRAFYHAHQTWLNQ